MVGPTSYLHTATDGTVADHRVQVLASVPWRALFAAAVLSLLLGLGLPEALTGGHRSLHPATRGRLAPTPRRCGRWPSNGAAARCATIPSR